MISEVAMVADRAKVLLILPQDVVDRARMLAGRMTTTLKLPVSLQIVVRTLIEEGLKQHANPAFIASVEEQAKTVRQLRAAGGRRARMATRTARAGTARRGRQR
jgi:hypothetical protein